MKYIVIIPPNIPPHLRGGRVGLDIVKSFMKSSEGDMKVGAGWTLSRVIHRVLQGHQDFALWAAPLHQRVLG
jgi:hypothetical protein